MLMTSLELIHSAFKMSMLAPSTPRIKTFTSIGPDVGAMSVHLPTRHKRGIESSILVVLNKQVIIERGMRWSR